jgi:NAD(P)-dependent dehydrogenase (short-subunit alcohol dehydrogenase family)
MASVNSASPLAGQHAVVTGGARGIGFAIARRLASLGASLTLLGRDSSRLYAAVQSLEGATCGAQACDVTDSRSVARAFEVIARAGTPVTVLINNAGMARSAKLAATDDALWKETLAVNLTGVYRMTRAALPALLAAPSGRIVNVASTAGLRGYPYVTAYSAAKHGVIGFTRALAAELASTAVTVNAVCPGYTDTDLVTDAIETIVAKTGKSPADARALLAARNPQRRLVAPEEVAAAVAWLCLPESRSVTGQAIAVAGGEVQVG